MTRFKALQGRTIPVKAGMVGTFLAAAVVCCMTASVAVGAPPPGGLVGLNGVAVSGGTVDSFDSSLGAYGGSNKSKAALVESNGRVALYGGAALSGSVVSTQGAISLASSAKVTGSVTAGGSVTNRGRVSGTVTRFAPSPAIVAPSVAACGPYSTATGITGGSFVYAPHRGNLEVVRGTVTLANGAYCFHNVLVGTGATLRVAGPVTIGLTGKWDTTTARILNTTHVPTNLQITSSHAGGAGMVIGGGDNAYMTVVAPKTTVNIYKGPYFGTVLAGKLNLNAAPAVHVDLH